jgi:hypothetical protein
MKKIVDIATPEEMPKPKGIFAGMPIISSSNE